MNKKFIIGLQLILVVGVLSFVYFAYPRAVVNVEDDFVKFSSVNANVIMISENSDFSNPRYLNFNESDSFGFEFKPGVYYWKPMNSLLGGFSKEFVVDSVVGLEKQGVTADSGVEEEDVRLVNIGNVKLNVSNGEGGVMVGHIILEPLDSEVIEDKGEYMGVQDG